LNIELPGAEPMAFYYFNFASALGIAAHMIATPSI
jgi:hypothetical protein